MGVCVTDRPDSARSPAFPTDYASNSCVQSELDAPSVNLTSYEPHSKWVNANIPENLTEALKYDVNEHSEAVPSKPDRFSCLTEAPRRHGIAMAISEVYT